MNKFMSLLSCICIVLVFVDFQSLVDGPGMSFVGGIICPQASQTCCHTLNIPIVLFSHCFLTLF